MKPFRILFFLFIINCLILDVPGYSQNTISPLRKSSLKISRVFTNKEDLLKEEFKRKGLQWPAKFIYIRSFKYDAQLEIWVKNSVKEKYKLFKIYDVCLQSGTMGPKRIEGDYQVPEGFYYVTEFNPNSSYHLSLGLNYPNPSDRILSDPVHPGGNIFIHGSCVSVGCVPVTDSDIEEIYIMASNARRAGQEYIPVHIFPIRFSNEKSVVFLGNFTKDNPELIAFSSQLEKAFNYFENKRQPPVILIDPKGNYIVGD